MCKEAKKIDAGCYESSWFAVIKGPDNTQYAVRIHKRLVQRRLDSEGRPAATVRSLRKAGVTIPPTYIDPLEVIHKKGAVTNPNRLKPLTDPVEIEGVVYSTRN